MLSLGHFLEWLHWIKVEEFDVQGTGVCMHQPGILVGDILITLVMKTVGCGWL